MGTSQSLVNASIYHFHELFCFSSWCNKGTITSIFTTTHVVTYLIPYHPNRLRHMKRCCTVFEVTKCPLCAHLARCRMVTWPGPRMDLLVISHPFGWRLSCVVWLSTTPWTPKVTAQAPLLHNMCVSLPWQSCMAKHENLDMILHLRAKTVHGDGPQMRPP